MKKLMSVMAMATLSTFMLVGCDSMSPREALDCLYELKKLSEKIDS